MEVQNERYKKGWDNQKPNSEAIMGSVLAIRGLVSIF